MQQQKLKASEGKAAWKAEQTKFKQTTTASSFDKNKYTNNGIYKSTPVYRGYDAKTQIVVRNNYYTHIGYHPPPYAYYGSSHYGVFDALFLCWVMDNMSRSAEARNIAHNYSNDPGFQQWKAEMEKQSANNAELKEKMAKMDSELVAMKNKPIDPNYVPKDIPAAVMVSPEAMMAKTPVKAPLNFATGTTTGMYHLFGDTLKANATGTDIKVLTTSGSMDNLKKLFGGEADMAVVQSDALAMIDSEFPGKKLSSEQTVLYPEFMQLIVNANSGIKDLGDMTNGKTTVCFPKGSGSAISWSWLCKCNKKYAQIPVKHVASNDACLTMVSQDPSYALFLVSALHSPVMDKAELMASEKKTLRLAEITDTSLLKQVDSHENKVYTYYEIPKTTYPALQKGWWFMKRNIDTLGVDAVLVVQNSWVEKYGADALDSLTLSILQTKSELEARKR